MLNDVFCRRFGDSSKWVGWMSSAWTERSASRNLHWSPVAGPKMAAQSHDGVENEPDKDKRVRPIFPNLGCSR